MLKSPYVHYGLLCKRGEILNKPRPEARNMTHKLSVAMQVLPRIGGRRNVMSKDVTNQLKEASAETHTEVVLALPQLKDECSICLIIKG